MDTRARSRPVAGRRIAANWSPLARTAPCAYGMSPAASPWLSFTYSSIRNIPCWRGMAPASAPPVPVLGVGSAGKLGTRTQVGSNASRW